MTVGNHRPSKSMPVDVDDHFEFFDSLPMELRRFLNDAPYVQSSKELASALAAGRRPEQLIDMVKRGMMDLMRREQREVWGDEDRVVDWDACGPLPGVRRTVRRAR